MKKFAIYNPDNTAREIFTAENLTEARKTHEGETVEVYPPMLAKISKKAYNDKVAKQRGEWMLIDTLYLFNDQYNTMAGNLRIFDIDISEIKNDARKGVYTCGYCGFQGTREELEEHYKKEEAAANNCAGCFWQLEHAKSEEKTTKREINENGETVEIITTRRTLCNICTYNKDYTGATCTHYAHRAHTLREFTPENTYFLKYPRGFWWSFENEFTTPQQWEYFGAKWDNEKNTATFYNAFGTYSAALIYNGATLEKFIVCNTRKTFKVLPDDLNRILNSYWGIRYFNRYKEASNGDTIKRDAPIFENFPESQIKALEKFIDRLRNIYHKSEAAERLILTGCATISEKEAEAQAFATFEAAESGTFNGFDFAGIFHEKYNKYNALLVVESDDKGDAHGVHVGADGITVYFFTAPEAVKKIVLFNRSAYCFAAPEQEAAR